LSQVSTEKGDHSLIYHLCGLPIYLRQLSLANPLKDKHNDY